MVVPVRSTEAYGPVKEESSRSRDKVGYRISGRSGVAEVASAYRAIPSIIHHSDNLDHPHEAAYPPPGSL